MLETTSMKAHWSQKLLSQFKIRFLNSTAFTLMKSRSVFQWLSKNKPSLCKPAPPLFCSSHPNSPPSPSLEEEKIPGIYPARVQKRRYFLYLYCTSTNCCQILRVLGNSNSTDPIHWMTTEDGAHRYPTEQSPRGCSRQHRGFVAIA